jgi:rare lipoprotein A
LRSFLFIIAFFIGFTFIGCTSSVRFSSSADTIDQKDSEYELEGYASYYADKFEGRKTASGDIFDQSKLTAAHKTLPFGTIVEVLNMNNGMTVSVIINDRGPFIAGRIIDLSYAAAKRLGMIQDGVVPVKLKILK